MLNVYLKRNFIIKWLNNLNNLATFETYNANIAWAKSNIFTAKSICATPLKRNMTPSALQENGLWFWEQNCKIWLAAIAVFVETCRLLADSTCSRNVQAALFKRILLKLLKRQQMAAE